MKDICVTTDQFAAVFSDTSATQPATSVPSSPSEIREPTASTTPAKPPADLTNSEQSPHEFSTSTPAAADAEAANTAQTHQPEPVNDNEAVPQPANDNTPTDAPATSADPVAEPANDNPPPTEASIPPAATSTSF